MKTPNLLNILSTFSIFVVVSSALNSVIEDVSSKSEELTKLNQNLRDKLIQPFQWVENVNTVLSIYRKQKDLKSDVTGTRDGRFLDFSSAGTGPMSGMNRHDMFIMTLNRALYDFGDICKEIADKFEEFVIENQANMMARQVGERKLNDLLNAFATTALNQAQAAVAAALRSATG